MKIIYIYNKRLSIIGQPWCKDLETFNQNPIKYCSNWTNDCYASAVKFNRPIWDNGTVREMTREEICESGDLSVLNGGEVWEDGVIKTVPIPDELFKPKWEYPIWVESMPLSEQEEYHNKLIDTLKAELLEDGFIYTDKNGAPHQQKCRDKDLSYLGNAIASMEDASIPTMKWYFNNGDMVELSLEEMKELRANGAIFVSIVFGIEAQLKSEHPTKNLTLTMFKDKVDAISTIKCFRG